MPTIAETEQLANRYQRAWEARDPDRIVSMHAPDGRFEAHAGGQPAAIGRDALRSAFAEIFERFPEFGVEVRRLLVGPGHWALDWTLTAAGGVRIGCVDLVELSEDSLVASKDTWVEIGAGA